MERSAHRDQRLHVIGRFRPAWQVAHDRRYFFFRFLDEQFQELRIQVLGVCRDDRRFNRQRRRLVDPGLGGFSFMVGGNGVQVLPGNPDGLRYRNGLFGLAAQALLEIPQDGKTGLRIVEHVPGLAATGFHRLHVVLDADDGVCQPVGFFLRQPAGPAAAQCQRDQAADAIDDVHRPRLVEHHEAGLDAANQCGNAVEALCRAGRAETLAERLLDAREIDNAFPHHCFRDILVLGILVGW